MATHYWTMGAYHHRGYLDRNKHFFHVARPKFYENLASTNPAHLGELWMVHGGGIYHVEKMSVGKVAVPSELHWFKWESYLHG